MHIPLSLHFYNSMIQSLTNLIQFMIGSIVSTFTFFIRTVLFIQSIFQHFIFCQVLTVLWLSKQLPFDGYFKYDFSFFLQFSKRQDWSAVSLSSLCPRSHDLWKGAVGLTCLAMSQIRYNFTSFDTDYPFPFHNQYQNNTPKSITFCTNWHAIIKIPSTSMNY